MGSRRQSSDDAAATLVGGVLVVIVVVALALAFRTLVEVIRIYREAQPGSAAARALWQSLGALGCMWAVAALMAAVGLPEAGALLAAWAFLAYTIFVSVVDERTRVREKEEVKAGDRLEEVLHWPLPEPQLSRVNGVHS